MLEECIVKRIKNGRAYVSLVTKDKCAGCKGCIFGKTTNKTDVPAIIKVDCKAGDKVLVEIPEREAVAAPVFLYLIPLAMMFIGLIIGNFINIAVQIILGFGLLALSFAIIFVIDKQYGKSEKFAPKIIKNINKENLND